MPQSCIWRGADERNLSVNVKKQEIGGVFWQHFGAFHSYAHVHKALHTFTLPFHLNSWKPKEQLWSLLDITTVVYSAEESHINVYCMTLSLYITNILLDTLHVIPTVWCLLDFWLQAMSFHVLDLFFVPSSFFENLNTAIYMCILIKWNNKKNTYNH